MIYATCPHCEYEFTVDGGPTTDSATAVRDCPICNRTLGITCHFDSRSMNVVMWYSVECHPNDHKWSEYTSGGHVWKTCETCDEIRLVKMNGATT